MKYLFILLMLFSCNTQEKNLLINTKWEYTVTKDCVSYISFMANGTYEDYDCERDYSFSGKYEITNDTIYLIEIDLESNLPDINEENNYKKVITRRITLINRGQYIQYVSWEAFENNKWLEPISPPNDIFYKKVQ